MFCVHVARQRTFVHPKAPQKKAPPVRPSIKTCLTRGRNGLYTNTLTGVDVDTCGTHSSGRPARQHGFGQRSRASSAPVPCHLSSLPCFVPVLLFLSVSCLLSRPSRSCLPSPTPTPHLSPAGCARIQRAWRCHSDTTQAQVVSLPPGRVS
jgi:hypothetical protein